MKYINNINISAKALKKHSLIILVLMLILMPSFAFATGMFEPNDGDISLNILSQMFGDLIDKASGKSAGFYANKGLWLGTGLDPFQYVLKIFNLCCLFVGGLLAAYSILLGVMNTAHEGVLLGKELNNPMFWIRTSAGVAFILPVWSGYCLLQVIVMWVIIQSVGMADTTWKAWFGVNDKTVTCSTGVGECSSIHKGEGNLKDLYSLKMPSPQVAEIAYKTFEGYTCLYGLASQQLEADFQQASASSNMENTENLKEFNKLSNDLVSTEQGKFGIVIPNNAKNPDTLATGYEPLGNNQIKTPEQLAKSREEEREKIADQRLEATKTKYTEIRNSKVNKANLDKYANDMFKMEYKSSDYVTEGGAKVGPNQLFVFGVGNPVGSTNITKDKQGNVKNTACGYIDFGNTSNSLGNARLYQVASKVTEYSNGMAVLNGSKSSMTAWGAGRPDGSQRVDNLKINSNDKEEVLKVYAKEYQSLHEAVKKLALEYVDEVNKEIRYPAWNNSKVDPRYESLAEENAQKRVELLVKYNEKIHSAYTAFEKNLIEALYQSYMHSNQENYNANRNKGKGNSITDLSNSNNNFGNYVDFIKVARDNASSDGWATAGMWYMGITQSISKLHELTSIRPAIGWASRNPTDYQNLFGNVGNRSNNAQNSPAMITQNLLGEINDSYGFFDEHAKYSPIKSISQKANESPDATNAIAALATGLDITNMFDSGRHPVIILTETGHNLISSAEKYMAFSSYWQQKNAKMITNNKGKSMPDPNNPMSQANVMISYFIGAIMVMGFMMAYYIPVLPFLIWIGAMLGWLISVAQAIIIAPLWGAMHLHPEGSKYTGKGAAGYQLLMSLALRPTLMILGLIASLVIVQVFGMFVNYIFAIGLNISLTPQGNSDEMTPSKLMYIFSLYGIYAIFMTGLITKMFNIITIVPDQVLQWIGGQNGNLSEYGAIGGSETYGKLNGLASTGGSAYATRLKSHGEQAGMKDSQTQRMLESGVNENGQKLSGAERTELENKQGAGFDELNTKMNQSSSSPYASANRDVQPYVSQPHNSAPSTVGEKQRYNDAYRNAEKVALDAGMGSQEAKDWAQQAASKGYNDPEFNAAMSNWASKGVFNRPTSEEATSVLYSATSNSSNGQEMVRTMLPTVQSVSSSSAPINVGHSSGGIAGSVQQPNVIYENGVPITGSGSSGTYVDQKGIGGSSSSGYQNLYGNTVSNAGNTNSQYHDEVNTPPRYQNNDTYGGVSDNAGNNISNTSSSGNGSTTNSNNMDGYGNRREGNKILDSLF